VSDLLTPSRAHHSKPLSWVWVSLISLGFAVGTVGVCIPNLPMTIVGGAVALASAIAALATGIMEDVDMHESRDLWPIGPRDRGYRRTR
jgi:hypothetical protein